ncbi:MAG: BACON domain-containing protein, partial [Prevotella sp.]|nr:BACON domain-containing protein [Prevotella sp.]
MNTINKLRLCLLAMLTLVAINSLADELVLDRSTISFNSSAHENILFKVKSDTGWMVDVTDPAGERIDWLYDINPASGDATGDGWATVTLKAKENESTEDRHATIIVKAGEASESISIIQYGKVVELVLSTDKLSFGQPAGDRTFTVTSNVAWTVKSSDESWLTITNNDSGEGNEAAPVTVTVHAKENTNSDSRPAKITVSGGGTSQTIEVTQLGKEANISLSTDKLSFGQPAG